MVALYIIRGVEWNVLRLMNLNAVGDGRVGPFWFLCAIFLTPSLAQEASGGVESDLDP